MEVTNQQQLVIDSNRNVCVNSVAGSGKTFTIIEYIKNKGIDKKVLYLVYNSSAKTDAEKRFSSYNLPNLRIETTHSLAYEEIIKKREYKLSKKDINPDEVIKICKIVHNSYYENSTYANLALSYMNVYCNSKYKNIDEVDFKVVKIPSDIIADKVLYYFKVLWNSMNQKVIDCSHDFYVKKYHMSNIPLEYDYIILDEGQDTSEIILDIFQRQNAIKMIVGDTHQQLYSWRYAIDALSYDFGAETLHLSNSFRFNEDIAELANHILYNKRTLYPNKDIEKIVGLGTSNNYDTHAIICRKNSTILNTAIRLINKEPDVKLYFEGGFNSYLFSNEDSVHDILHLYNENLSSIRNSFIKQFKTFKELGEHIYQNDNSKSYLASYNLIKEYGDSFEIQLNKIKERISISKNVCDYILTNAHKSKGLEYDVVEVSSDFYDHKQIVGENKKSNLTKLNEEINLLYVAITRSKNIILIPKKYLKQFYDIRQTKKIFLSDDIYHNECKRWTQEEDEQILSLSKIDFVASLNMKRNRRSIENRLEYLKTKSEI